jgi:hypothetical protein
MHSAVHFHTISLNMCHLCSVNTIYEYNNKRVCANAAFYIVKLSTPCILAANFLFLFQLNVHNKLNVCIFIYHLIHPPCFDVYYTIFRETIALFAQELYDFCDVVTPK